MHIFSIDSKLMRMLGRIGDLIILNVLFLITSLPVFTIGASLTALFTICFRMGYDRESAICKNYFQAFKDNFQQATEIFLILVVIIAVLLLNMSLSFSRQDLGHYMTVPFGILLILVLFVAAYAFPLLSQFNNRNLDVIRNSVLLSLGFFPRSFLLIGIMSLPVVMFIKNPIGFMQLSPIFLSIYFSAGAYLGTKIFNKIFTPYWHPDELEDSTVSEDE